MANSFSYRQGQRELVKLPVATATVIEIGDIVAWHSSDSEVHPASDEPWDTNEATTQANFADHFMGIAVESSSSSQNDDITVDISALAVYEFTVISNTFDVGDSLGVDSASNALQDQVLAAQTTATSAIARSFERKASASTLLKVKFASAFNTAANATPGTVG